MDKKPSFQKKSKKFSFFLGIILGSIFAIGGIFFLFSTSLNQYSHVSSRLPVLIPLGKKDIQREEASPKTMLDSSINITPFQQNQVKVKLALVFVSVGGEEKTLLKALKIFPKQVSFSFSPFIPNVSEWIMTVHQQGHDVLLDVPLESLEYPQLNEGSYTLLKGALEEENLSKLAFILEKGKNEIAGIYGFMGSRICRSKKDMYPILKMLKKKGYLFLESKTPHSCVKSLAHLLNLPYYESTQVLPYDVSDEEFKKGLQDLEKEALKDSSVIGIGHLEEASLDILKTWMDGLSERGINLVSISTLSKEESI
ncbi:MAG: divergent polysaccharide deacetylase family protein [Proteobacteria bacterium]|nr:divergent polysaccharide deacetylase family protein [Pseudomonadota bacterium]